jgi:hypothetical protein
MARDLTAILLPQGQCSEDEIRALAARFGDVWLRIAPLPSAALTQVEILDGARGLPCESPELLMELSKGGRAAFVHVNHAANQALVHAFAGGEAQPGWVGGPGELDDKLRAAVGCALDELQRADDGTRLGIGVAASHTVAFVRGRRLAVPPGTPTSLNSFTFHDRGAEVGDGTRIAPFAFDAQQVRLAFAAPARELAAHLSTARKGPMEGARTEVIAALAAMEDRPLRPDDAAALRALELCTLDAACVFGGGDRQYFWDHRVLPMFLVGDAEPRFDPDEFEDLEESASVLEAMVDVLPYAAPPGGEGSIVSNLGPGELLPLAPWAEGQDEYTGSVFRLACDRLLGLVRGLDGAQLNPRIERFERAWFQAARGGLNPSGDAFDTWRRIKAESGERDVERFIVDWTELRIVLELAAANQLATGLLFYE